MRCALIAAIKKAAPDSGRPFFFSSLLPRVSDLQMPIYLNPRRTLMHLDETDDSYLQEAPHGWNDALTALCLVVLCALAVF